MVAGLFKKTLDPLGLTVDDGTGTCFVTSGTSVVGHRVAIGLLQAGCKNIRVGFWKGKRQVGVDDSIGQRVLEELEAKGATVINFDWTDEDCYKMALSGVKSVFCTIPHMNASVETFENFVKACRKAGVEHFVKTSFYSSGGDPYVDVVPYVGFSRKCDDILTKFKLDSVRNMTHTILATSHLMSAPLVYQGPVLREELKYTSASYGMGVNYCSPNDVAKAAIVTLVKRKKHRNKVYNLTGPQPVTDEAVAKYLAQFYEERIEHVPIGYHAMEDVLRKRKFPDWLVTDLAGFEKVKASGVDEFACAYSKDAEKLIGGKRERFGDYLKNKDQMTLQEYPRPQVIENKVEV